MEFIQDNWKPKNSGKEISKDQGLGKADVFEVMQVWNWKIKDKQQEISPAVAIWCNHPFVILKNSYSKEASKAQRKIG